MQGAELLTPVGELPCETLPIKQLLASLRRALPSCPGLGTSSHRSEFPCTLPGSATLQIVCALQGSSPGPAKIQPRAVGQSCDPVP